MADKPTAIDKNPNITPLRQLVVFTLTFLCYVGLHSIRAAWAYSKSILSKQYGYAQWVNGGVDVAYLLSYSAGMATIGTMTNRFRLNLFLGCGMMLAALFFSSFALVDAIWGDFLVPVMFVGMALNGFFQSTGWPGMMATMGNWFGKGRRGLLLAFWSVNANVGNIVGSVVCSNLKENWKMNVFVTACICAGIGLVIILFLKPKPVPAQPSDDQIKNSLVSSQVSNENINQPERIINNTSGSEQEVQPVESPKPKRKLNVFTALLLPRVGFYVVGYAMLKGCVYGLLFWLPSYLDQKNLSSQKGYISAMVDVGALFGGMLVGHLGDIYQLRALFLSPLLFLGSIVMFIVSQALDEYALPYYFLMCLIGIFTGGPYNVIGSAIAVDLGQQPMLKDTPNAVSIISALVQGSAAVFSALSQIVIPLISLNMMFVAFCCESIVATVALLPLFLQDLKLFRERLRADKLNTE